MKFFANPWILPVAGLSALATYASPADGRCQSNGSTSPLWHREPKSILALGQDCPPLGQRGGASLPVDFATDDVAFLAEMVVD